MSAKRDRALATLYRTTERAAGAGSYVAVVAQGFYLGRGEADKVVGARVGQTALDKVRDTARAQQEKYSAREKARELERSRPTETERSEPQGRETRQEEAGRRPPPGETRSQPIRQQTDRTSAPDRKSDPPSTPSRDARRTR